VSTLGKVIDHNHYIIMPLGSYQNLHQNEFYSLVCHEVVLSLLEDDALPQPTKTEYKNPQLYYILFHTSPKVKLSQVIIHLLLDG
jgi:hypothetical protein